MTYIFSTLHYGSQEYRTLVEAEANPRHFIEEVYATKRLHLSLGQMPPAEFEVTRTQ